MMVHPRFGAGGLRSLLLSGLGAIIEIPRGRVLGDSSSINGLIYIRGQREDFDDWRDLGNSGWGDAR
jgi:choline dehydrogenase-like flavoprotein